jgi:hypothetical protein
LKYDRKVLFIFPFVYSFSYQITIIPITRLGISLPISDPL